MRPPPSLLSSMPRASCSYTVSSSPLVTSLSTLSLSAASSRRPFSSSAVARESEFKRVRRMNRQNVSKRNAELREDWFNTQPDPFLGMQLVYANGVPVHEQRWRQTKLAATILDPTTLWTTGVNAPKNVFSALSNAKTGAHQRYEKEIVPTPDAPSTTKIYTSRLSLEDKMAAATTPTERSVLADALREDDALTVLEKELQQKADELEELQQLRRQVALVEREETLRDQVMAAAIRMNVVPEQEMTRDHPVVVAELERIKQLGFGVQEEGGEEVNFPEDAQFVPTEDGSAGNWLKKLTDNTTTTQQANATAESSPSTVKRTAAQLEQDRLAAEFADQDAARDAKAERESSSKHRPVLDDKLLPIPTLPAQPAPDYSRSPLITLFGTDNPIDAFPVPTFLAYMLSNADKRFVFNTLPHVTAQRDIMPLPGVKLTEEDMRRRVERAEDKMEQERRSLEAMGKILNLKNADAKAIMKENTRRVVAAFGHPEWQSKKTTEKRVLKGPECGSPEVQAAVMTLKIRALRAHLVKNMQDKAGDYRIRQMAHDRKRVLEYLKRLDPVRYDKCLMEIGVDKRAVEGELIIHKYWRQVLPKGRHNRITKFVGKVGRTKTLKGNKRINPRSRGGEGLLAYY